MCDIVLSWISVEQSNLVEGHNVGSCHHAFGTGVVLRWAW